MPEWVKPWLCISALALGVFLSIRPVFQLIERAMVDGVASSAATMVAAAFGFSAVAWQTRRGFQNLAISQARQAGLDREAREHQAEIARRAKAADRLDEQQALAAALSGELNAAFTRLSNGLPVMRIQKAVYEEFGKTIPTAPVDVSLFMPLFEPQIFQANISRLGLLGPSIASDVVEIYQLLVWRRELPVATKLTGESLAAIVQAHVGVVEKWVVDHFHIRNRLISLFGQHSDPGPLYFTKAKATDAKT
ncbi:hypothetical protein NKH49_26940 [Mesorhizobium sp. M1088]|uniref:hypothetical protein n=1 Tax=Mesorhizobium sp. M1088 TaxID=2957056 RepID=UPI00333A7EF8